nr:MAG TPA: hypothetical protein [Caudoviricetes sp.]
MNRKQFNALNEGDILYCNGRCGIFKGLKVRVLRTENYAKDGRIVTIKSADERFPNMQDCVLDLSYKSLSVDPIIAEPGINALAYEL